MDVADNLVDLSKEADLIFVLDELSMGSAMVQQAKKLGAKLFVHYYVPRHMEQTVLSARRDLIKEECSKSGLAFLDIAIPDPVFEGMAASREFIQESIPKMVEEYGVDTAFFATNCSDQETLIKLVADTGAIFLQPCHPSPQHGFPVALDVGGFRDQKLLQTEMLRDHIKQAIVSCNMSGRMSTWPFDYNEVSFAVGMEYAIKRLNGEVPKEGFDIEVLTQMMTDYAGVQVYLTPYTDLETGVEYNNVLMVRMDYITF